MEFHFSILHISDLHERGPREREPWRRRRVLGESKTFSRIVRFQNALVLLKGHPSCTLADIAARCGYYDQSHFVKECRIFAGVVPSAQAGYFPAGAKADFSPNLVQFLQDAGAQPGESSPRDCKESKR